MDLIFKRYSSPFDYLDALLIYGSFGEGIANIWNTAQEDKTWDFYLSNNPMNNKSYDDWKQELKAQNKTAMSKAEIGATVEKSQNILKDFKPLAKTKNN